MMNLIATIIVIGLISAIGLVYVAANKIYNK